MAQPAEVIAARRSRKGRVIVAGGVAAVALGVILFLALGKSPSPTPHANPDPTATATAATTTTTPQTSATSASAPADRTVRVQSTPSGAAVKEGDKLLCLETPCNVTWSGAAAAPDVKHVLLVSKEGYETAELVVTADGEPEPVELEKSKASSPRPPIVRPPIVRPPRPPPTTKPTTKPPTAKPSATLTGYKPSPYGE